MKILSNGFPTNLPNSEVVSQGGPANFARLFVAYLEATHPTHQWVGVMLKGAASKGVRLERVFASAQRSYYRLSMPKGLLRTVVHATNTKVDPSVLWKKPVDRLAAFIRAERPDVVFLNGFGILNWMLLRAAHQCGVPVVIQHAGIWSKELDIHKEFNSPAGRRLMKAMEHDSTRLAAMEVFLNRWSLEYYAAHVAAGSPERKTVIPLPFNFEAFGHLQGGAGGSRFTFDPAELHIGVIARWDKIKNHKAVLALAREAKRRGLPWRIHSVVSIPDHKNYVAHKRAYARHVNMVAPLDRAGIADFCRSVDLLMLPSLFDVSPTVVLEAVALGTPIVISPTIGYVHDFADHGAREWIIDPANAAKTVRRIKRLAGKPLPRALTRRIKEAHDHTVVFDAYLNIFTQVSAPLYDKYCEMRQPSHMPPKAPTAPKSMDEKERKLAPHRAGM